MHIEYHSSIPKPFLTLVSHRLNCVKGLFPAWCSRVVVNYSIAEEDIASCNVQYEYRTFILTLHPPFFDDGDWHHSLIHEIQHGLLKPIIQFGDKLIEHYVNDEHTTKFLLDQFAYLEEQVAEDLSLFAKELLREQSSQALSEADETRPSNGQAAVRRGKGGIPKKFRK